MKIMSICILSIGAVISAGQSTEADSDSAARLHALFDERYAWEMEQFPEVAMARGDYSNADKLTLYTIDAIESRQRQTERDLSRLLEIDRSSLRDEDRVSHDLFEWKLRQELEKYHFRMFLVPLNSRSGPQQRIAQMHERVRFDTVEDYSNYIKRLLQVPAYAKQVILLMRQGLEEGRTPPQITMVGVPDQLQRLLDGELMVLRTPFEHMPASIPTARQEQLTEMFTVIAYPQVLAAVKRIHRFFLDDYLPNCRQSIAVSDMPDGAEWYRFLLRYYTTTDLTAQQIHEIGLKEVERIRTEMLEVIRSTDFMNTPEARAAQSDTELFEQFLKFLRTDPRFYYETAEQLLTGYRDLCKIIDAHLPKLFVLLPRLPYGVKEIPAFMAPTQTTAYYQEGSIENSEAGYFYANTYALDQRPKYEMIALALHEAVPGHHLQIALAQELTNIPKFRAYAYHNVFGEGWALYAERLGVEMGLYEDPYDDFGRLLYEMWRACRLVVDPGMHALGWSRDQAIDFMTNNTALSALNIRNEVDRYISWPGQATSYKIGELKIRELRARAEQELSERFDVRQFHRVVLGAGSVPMDILEQRVLEWIAEMQLTQ